jgi:hypothetical protein
LELYTLHVLPRVGEWEYAEEFIGISPLLDEERKEAFLQALGQLRGEMEAEKEREREIEREREREMDKRRKADQRQRDEEQRKREVNEHKTWEKGNASLGSANNGVEARGGIKSGPGPGSQNGVGKGPQSRQPAKHNGRKRSEVSVYKRASAMWTALQANLAEAVRNMSGNPMLMLRFLLFLIAFLSVVGRRQVRERLKKALEQAWDKFRRTIGMGVKVSYI